MDAEEVGANPEAPVDEDEEMVDASEPGEEAGDDDVDQDEAEDEEDESEGEEIVDTVAVEKEELRKDGLSLERREKEEAKEKEELADGLH
jgi:hypothetical protein